MNMKVLKSILEFIGKCPICNSNIDLNPDVENKNGLSIPLQLRGDTYRFFKKARHFDVFGGVGGGGCFMTFSNPTLISI